MAEPFTDYRAAARAVLALETLSEKEGQFCGGLAYRFAPPSAKQANWLRILLDRHALPPLIDGSDHV